VKFREYIQNETLSKIVEKLDKFDLEKDLELEEFNVKIKLKR
jgi:hypothetical protein